MIWIELSVWGVMTWIVGSLVFAGYEAHVPWTKRTLKLTAMLVTLTLVHVLLGRIWFYSIITVAAAEPRAKYLALIGRAGDEPRT